MQGRRAIDPENLQSSNILRRRPEKRAAMIDARAGKSAVVPGVHGRRLAVLSLDERDATDVQPIFLAASSSRHAHVIEKTLRIATNKILQ